MDSWDSLDPLDEEYCAAESGSFDERLIEEVAKCPALYDIRHPHYRDLDRKDSLWKDVALLTDRKVTDCKKRWRSLRDNYRRYQKSPDKYGPVTSRKVALFGLLSFLDTVEMRKTTDEYRKSKRSKTSHAESPVIVRYGSQSDQPPIKVEPPDLEPATTPETPATSPAPPRAPPAIQYFVLKPDCVRTPLDYPATGSRPPPPEEDELDGFLRLMGQTVRRFSPRFQIEAKKKIFDVVTEIELRNCTEAAPPAPAASSSGAPSG